MKDYFRTIKMAVGYNGKPLMEQIEIGLSKGEILTLIGPNGSGKSTILKSIAGQLTLLGGKMCIRDRYKCALAPVKRETGANPVRTRHRN